MSSHLPYTSYVGRTTSKLGGSSYNRTSSAPSSTNSLDRPSRVSSYGTPNTARSSSYTRFGATRGYSVDPERPKSPERRVVGLRMGSTSRFGAQIARSPISEKSPTVFGISPRTEEERLTLVTRSTSPTPPSNSSFLRAKRADQERTLTLEVPKPSFRPVSISSSVQTEEIREETPPPPVEKKIPTNRPWGQRATTPRYSTAGGYSYVRREPEKTRVVGGFGLKPELTSKAPSPTRELPSKLPISQSKPETHPPPIPRTDPLGNVNKDFRKSILNMDLSSSNDSQEKGSLASMKSRSNLKLVLNKSPTSITVTQVNGKTSTKKEETSSSEESSSSEDSSSEESDNGQTLKPPSPKFPATSRGSGDESLQHKPPASPKSVVVKTLPPVAAPMKVQLPPEEIKKPQGIRKLDSSDNARWKESQKDIPAVIEAQTSPVKKSPSKTVIENDSNETNKTTNKGYVLRKFDSTDKPWWNDSNSDTPGSEKKKIGLKKTPSKDKLTTSSEQSKPSSQSESDSKIVGKLSKSGTKTDIPKIPSSPSSPLVNNATKPSPPQSETESKSIGLSKLYKSGSKTDVSKSLSSSAGSLNNVTAPSPLQSDTDKSLGLNNLYRTGSKSDLSKTSSSVSLNKLSKTTSQKSLAAKPPSPPARRSDVLDPPTEYTPGLLRIHNERQWMNRLPRVDSGLREWWLSEEELEEKKKEARASIGGYSGHFKDIDHVLGNAAPPPAAFRTPNTSDDDSDSSDDSWYKQIKSQAATNGPVPKANGDVKVDDSALQLYKDGDYGAYLDLEASINEQQEEFDNFNMNQKNSIVLRTQLPVRVHTIIEKLLKSEGRELRRALFSLKQIFQEDKDLVHEFVQNEGLSTLIKVGTDADQNYQNYILRALGQVMLYVDGMNGVINHPGTVQWLYDLVSSKFRLVVKTALKLLLVFVEYADTNCVLLVKAIRGVDYVRTSKPWSNVMKLIKECDVADTELLIYAMTLINKTLNGLPDQDMYYDQVDAIEEQGLETIIRKYMAKQGADLDLLRQFQIYEAVLRHEDGDEKGTPLRQLDESIRKAVKNRKSLTGSLDIERRKSRRYSTGNTPLTLTLTPTRLIASQDTQSDDTLNINGENGVGVTPGLRRRRERAERQKSFIREQREATLRAQQSSSEASSEEANSRPSRAHHRQSLPVQPPPPPPGIENGDKRIEGEDEEKCRDGLVRDLSQKLANNLHSPGDESKYPFSDMKGIISKAKEELAKSQSRGEALKSPTTEMPRPEIKKTETELHWEEMARSCIRLLKLCDLDFTDLGSDEERDVLAPAGVAGGIPPPPPPVAPPPVGPPPPIVEQNKTSTLPHQKKTKKTVKLFWKEVRDDPIVMTKMSPGQLLWDELLPVVIDTQKLEHLFESRAKDLITKKQQEMNKNKEIIVLDHKRSNAINIGMTKLPPPRSIKTAILKMDATVMNREGIEKLLTMLPTEEERSKIQEAQAANPDLPLGSAEQFLLTLASISELPARLKLWAFKLDYENSEKEIAERLMDLKQGMETLKVNKTFRAILGTLLSIGIFLNGSEVKGFQIEYLAKVPEVKDTVHKHTLLHHLCHMVMEKFPDATDLYSEIGAVTRASKVDFEELASNIQKMEQECKASFDHLKVISKHDGASNMKLKMSDFLADSAERIIVLGKVHRRVLHRFHKFCLWLGIPLHRAALTKPNELCRIISEFALEYRTTRERVIQQLEKKANHRERNKTRGKMITEVGKFRSQEDRADAELKELLDKSNQDRDKTIHGSLPWRRTRKTPVGHISSPTDLSGRTNGNLSDADDEILESLVKTATKTPVSRSTTPRERKRTRNADLIKRSRTRDNVPAGGGSVSESA
ncbi:FH1/FH2 domain-containing protein 1 isoform X3 [Halyomorpha halys]|uniref:FH1/FH2 domain-containing protein 1 isoform X3 n=1 Tax=Halyomorpha halys TaxID=286706 RepID=UPI0006D51D84